MELTMPRATVSLTLFFVVICTVDAMNYLAFPRMGRSAISEEDLKRAEMPWNMIFPRKRGMLPENFILPRKRDNNGKMGYLAFPRMGRSQTKAQSVTSEQSGDCCGIGIKSEFSIADDGKEEMRVLCSASVAVCCEGLREVADEKPDGGVYSLCVPDVMKLFPSSYDKLKTLLSK